MNKDEQHEAEKKTIVRSALSGFHNIIQTFVACLWVIAVLSTVERTPILTTIGVSLVVVNIFSFLMHLRRGTKHSEEFDEWQKMTESRMIRQCFERVNQIFDTKKTCYFTRCGNTVSENEKYCVECRSQVEV